jgi:uncharacterized protein YcfJ
MKLKSTLIIASLLASTTAFAQYPGQVAEQYNNQYNNQHDNRYDHNYPRPAYVAPSVIPTQSFTDYARIKRVTPQYGHSNQPSQICHDEVVQEQVYQQQNRNMGGAALGAIAGGILGNQVGGGNGRTAATAVGVIGGALAGDNIAANNQNGPQYVSRTVQRCEPNRNYNNRVVSGYLVEYEYRGQTSTFVSPTEPTGNRLKINLTATPSLY